MKKWVIGGGAVIALIVAIMAFGGDSSDVGRTEYQTVAADTGTISRRVAASGSVDAVTMVEISTEVSGLISEMYVDFNSPVKAGELLAVINPQTFESRLRQRRAELQVAEASVTVSRAEIGSSEAVVAKAERDYERVAKLRETGNVSEAAVDTAATTLETSTRSLAIQRARLINALATVEIRKAALEQAEIDLERTSIRSPIDGIVIERSIEIGQTVAASFSAPKLFRIARDLEEIEIEASIDEADIGNIVKGNKVSFTVDAYPTRQFAGEVRQVRLAPTIEQNVVTYTVVITASNSGQLLLPGMTANVDIITGERAGVVRISNRALRFRPRGAASDRESGGARGGGDMTARMMSRLQESIALSDDQVKELQKALEPALKEMRDAFQGGQSGFGRPNRAQIMQKFREATEEALASIATPEQMRAYQDSGRTNSRGESGRPGTVWVLNGDGEPESKRIMLGINDDQFTEMVSGSLKPGDQIIVSARTIQPED